MRCFFEPAIPRISSMVLNAERQREITEYMRDSSFSPVDCIANEEFSLFFSLQANDIHKNQLDGFTKTHEMFTPA